MVGKRRAGLVCRFPDGGSGRVEGGMEVVEWWVSSFIIYM